jgi:excisionase family DNA binding protein
MVGNSQALSSDVVVPCGTVKQRDESNLAQTCTAEQEGEMPETNPAIWLTLAQAAQHLQASPSTIRRAVHRGDLRVAVIGLHRCWRFRAGWLDIYAESRSTPVEIETSHNSLSRHR